MKCINRVILCIALYSFMPVIDLLNLNSKFPLQYLLCTKRAELFKNFCFAVSMLLSFVSTGHWKGVQKKSLLQNLGYISDYRYGEHSRVPLPSCEPKADNNSMSSQLWSGYYLAIALPTWTSHNSRCAPFRWELTPHVSNSPGAHPPAWACLIPKGCFLFTNLGCGS